MDTPNKMKTKHTVQTPVNSHDGAALKRTSMDYAELWKVIRAVLAVWAVAVWLLLVMMPGMQQISDLTTALLHLPQVFIGLGLLGAMFAAYNLHSDTHMLWFLGALLLLAGWM
ncbi:MAG: hypothetical protein CR991_06905 [Proteobacteria bacterium]|nr:MAG: hypothetical protein CR991_06905 [Pseudomonadota bacterium]